MRSIFTVAIALVLFSSCTPKDSRLPIFGERDFNGKDTVYHTIAPFAFLDQDSVLVTNDTFKGKMYVTDFFFTTCRTICPVMKTQMKRVYDATANDNDLLILSHTIDPQYDDVTRLNKFAKLLDVSSERWHFVTGSQDTIYKLAQTSYFSAVKEDKEAKSGDDGFIHSGAFLLIDKHQRIRGKYDGTREADVNRLLSDIKKLRNEEGQ